MAAMARAALCLCLCLIASEVRGFHVPQKMKRTIQNLLEHYNISRREKFNGKPVFSKHLLTGKDQTQMVFMGGVLETYEKLLGRMLEQLPTASTPPQLAGEVDVHDVHEQLRYILTKIQELKSERYKEPEELLQRLQTLGHIQVDDHVVQSKALWELPWLYEKASVLSDPSQGQRRRRRTSVRG